MLKSRSVSTKDLEGVLDRARATQPTYEAVGATAATDFPAGFRHDRHELRVGDASRFERAKKGLSSWQAHVGAGVRVLPGNAIAEGDTVLVLFALGLLQIIAPCRIVYVIDEPNRFGFAFGTLPGHPECGEEAFIVAREGTDTLFRITAFSRPAVMLTKVGKPVARRLQHRFTDRCLEGLACYVAADAVP